MSHQDTRRDLLAAYAHANALSLRGIALDAGIDKMALWRWVTSRSHTLTHVNCQHVDAYLIRAGLWKCAEPTEAGRHLLSKFGGAK